MRTRQRLPAKRLYGGTLVRKGRVRLASPPAVAHLEHSVDRKPRPSLREARKHWIEADSEPISQPPFRRILCISSPPHSFFRPRETAVLLLQTFRWVEGRCAVKHSSVAMILEKVVLSISCLGLPSYRIRRLPLCTHPRTSENSRKEAPAAPTAIAGVVVVFLGRGEGHAAGFRNHSGENDTPRHHEQEDGIGGLREKKSKQRTRGAF